LVSRPAETDPVRRHVASITPRTAFAVGTTVAGAAVRCAGRISQAAATNITVTAGITICRQAGVRVRSGIETSPGAAVSGVVRSRLGKGDIVIVEILSYLKETCRA